MSFDDEPLYKAVILNWDAAEHKEAVRMWQGYNFL